MPFIYRCPIEACGKFLLLEDEDQGETIVCLCCKQEIEVYVQLQPVDREAPPTATTASVPRSTGERILVRSCPNCSEEIAFPEEKKRHAIQCPSCEYWGIVN